MGDYSSYEEDFTEITLSNSTEDESPKKDVKKDDNPFEILSMENILQDVSEIVAKVQSFLELYKSSPIRALLTHYKWDFQRLIGEYFESDRDTFFGQAQLPNPFNVLPVSQPTHDSNDCKICFSEETPDNLYSLECGHKYCKMCWNQYLSVKIADDGVNDTIFCPEQKCGILVDDVDVIQLVTSPEVLLKYQRSMSNSFVQHNQAMRWCPSAGCSYAAKKKQISKSPCTCKCGHEFCFDCMEYWHVPISCSRLKQWKNNDDGETFQWIAQNAKLCPGCQAIIEKNGGCNHMTCRNCRHEFCWVCAGDWNRHHACNRFDETKSFGVLEVARFKHFQERYVNQLESLRLEGNFYRDLEAKIEHLKEMCSMTNNEVRFLRDAVKVLHVSRRTLTYTFVFAYFLQKNNQVEIFEDNQSDLESAVERLSGYLEQEITTDNIVDLKKNIQDEFKYCEKRCNVLMEHIHEAEENKLWKMNT